MEEEEEEELRRMYKPPKCVLEEHTVHVCRILLG